MTERPAGISLLRCCGCVVMLVALLFQSSMADQGPPHTSVDLGDFNSDGRLDDKDIDALSREVVNGTNDARFDLNDDGLVNFDDRKIWVEDLKNTWIGDANLDLQFNSSDMVQVFAAGKYEKQENATWGQGDWNGDQNFDSSDMVAAFAGGGYEAGLRDPQAAAASAVPEPSAQLIGLLGMLGLLWRRRRAS